MTDAEGTVIQAVGHAMGTATVEGEGRGIRFDYHAPDVGSRNIAARCRWSIRAPPDTDSPPIAPTHNRRKKKPAKAPTGSVIVTARMKAPDKTEIVTFMDAAPAAHRDRTNGKCSAAGCSRGWSVCVSRGRGLAAPRYRPGSKTPSERI
jgi:hypothetical protein